MMEIADKNILVVGLGISGVAATRFLKNRGANITVTDVAGEEALGSHVQVVRNMGVRMELGQHNVESFERADLIVLSPGVSHTIPPVTKAKELGITVIGELELASRFIREPVIAITGTNGKTTTTELLGKMLVNSGFNVFVGGNIGNPLIGYPDKKERAEIVVAEVSSFQLDTIDTFRPQVAVLLNITEDHLDRYPDFSAYVASKGSIFKNQRENDTAVLNGSDAFVRAISKKIKAKKLFYGHQDIAHSIFQEGAAISDDSLIILKTKNMTHEDEKKRNSVSIDLSHINLMGRHNRENVAAASLATLAVGGTLEGIQSALNSFKGLSHRLEFVAMVNDVGYYNDSKATNVDSVARALECFSEPVILIMGGRNKGGNFRLLEDLIRRHTKKLIVMGEAKEALQSALGHIKSTDSASSMEDAVSSAYHAAAPGDAVLLSPGCSSFDMYSSYAERGENFRKALEKLKRQNQWTVTKIGPQP